MVAGTGVLGVVVAGAGVLGDVVPRAHVLGEEVVGGVVLESVASGVRVVVNGVVCSTAPGELGSCLSLIASAV